MRQDQIEEAAAEIAGDLVVELVRFGGVRLPPEVTQRLAQVARRGLVNALARMTAVKVQAQTASVTDLRTR